MGDWPSLSSSSSSSSVTWSSLLLLHYHTCRFLKYVVVVYLCPPRENEIVFERTYSHVRLEKAYSHVWLTFDIDTE